MAKRFRRKRLEPPAPDTANYQPLNLPNSHDLALRFCQYPEGSYLVERVKFADKEFWVMLRKPDTIAPKAILKDCSHQRDFTVWVVEHPNGNCWMPRHLAILEAFSKLPYCERKKIFTAIKSVVLDFNEPVTAANQNNCVSLLMGNYPALLWLACLKWMAALEDTLYPPPKYLGRHMAFAGYVLVHSEFYRPEDLRRVLKVFAR